MKTIDEKITINELQKMSKDMFGNLVKAVVDIKRKIMVVNAELHSDEERVLIEDGSKQENLWGINIYPDLPKKDQIEFDSMINLRPKQNNRSRGIDDSKIKKKIILICNKLIKQ